VLLQQSKYDAAQEESDHPRQRVTPTKPIAQRETDPEGHAEVDEHGEKVLQCERHRHLNTHSPRDRHKRGMPVASDPDETAATLLTIASMPLDGALNMLARRRDGACDDIHVMTTKQRRGPVAPPLGVGLASADHERAREALLDRLLAC
jgi:hypothetical protein